MVFCLDALRAPFLMVWFCGSRTVGFPAVLRFAPPPRNAAIAATLYGSHIPRHAIYAYLHAVLHYCTCLHSFMRAYSWIWFCTCTQPRFCHTLDSASHTPYACNWFNIIFSFILFSVSPLSRLLCCALCGSHPFACCAPHGLCASFSAVYRSCMVLVLVCTAPFYAWFVRGCSCLFWFHAPRKVLHAACCCAFVCRIHAVLRMDTRRHGLRRSLASALHGSPAGFRCTRLHLFIKHWFLLMPYLLPALYGSTAVLVGSCRMLGCVYFLRFALACTCLFRLPLRTILAPFLCTHLALPRFTSPLRSHRSFISGFACTVTCHFSGSPLTSFLRFSRCRLGFTSTAPFLHACTFYTTHSRSTTFTTVLFCTHCHHAVLSAAHLPPLHLLDHLPFTFSHCSSSLPFLFLTTTAHGCGFSAARHVLPHYWFRRFAGFTHHCRFTLPVYLSAPYHAVLCLAADLLLPPAPTLPHSPRSAVCTVCRMHLRAFSPFALAVRLRFFAFSPLFWVSAPGSSRLRFLRLHWTIMVGSAPHRFLTHGCCCLRCTVPTAMPPFLSYG